MGTENTLVSIVIPVYNAQRFIEDTVRSVSNQTFQDWELILVDDGSEDESSAIIDHLAEKEERIRAVHLTGGGAAVARNTGTKQARGRYLAFLDADDLWESTKLEEELKLMRKKDAAFVFTGYEFADETGRGTGKVVHVPECLQYKEALKNTTIFTSTVLFDMEKTGRELLYMPQVKSEDTALWWRVLKAGFDAYGLNKNLVKYRRAGKSLSSNKLEAVRRIWNLYRKQEKLSVPASMYYFVFWAWNAVARRVSVDKIA